MLSYAIDFSTAIKAIGKIFDEGYKIDIKKLEKIVHSNSNVQNAHNKYNFSAISRFGIIINVGYSTYLNVTTNSEVYDIIDELKATGVLEPLTNEETEIYQKNPGFLGIAVVLGNAEKNSKLNKLDEMSKILEDRDKKLEDRNQKLEDVNKRLDDIYQNISQLKNEKIELLQQKEYLKNIEQAENISSEFSKYLNELIEKETQLDEQLSNLETEVNKMLKKSL